MAKGKIDVVMSPAEIMGGNVTRVSFLHVNTRFKRSIKSIIGTEHSKNPSRREAHVLISLKSMGILEPAALQRSNSGEED
jgi:hypothetical protein